MGNTRGCLDSSPRANTCRSFPSIYTHRLVLSALPLPPPPRQVDGFCKLLSDFTMEYRTTHGKVMARLERKKHERERKKTKGKFIVSPPPPPPPPPRCSVAIAAADSYALRHLNADLP